MFCYFDSLNNLNGEVIFSREQLFKHSAVIIL
jgi:hypothetical protein